MHNFVNAIPIVVNEPEYIQATKIKLQISNNNISGNRVFRTFSYQNISDLLKSLSNLIQFQCTSFAKRLKSLQSLHKNTGSLFSTFHQVGHIHLFKINVEVYMKNRKIQEIEEYLTQIFEETSNTGNHRILQKIQEQWNAYTQTELTTQN